MPDPSGTFRSSYTLTLAVAGDLAIAIALGILGVNGFIAAPAQLWEFSPLVLIAVGATAFYIVKANLVRFGAKKGFARRDCWLSVFVTAGAAALVWVVAWLVLSAVGADFY